MLYKKTFVLIMAELYTFVFSPDTVDTHKYPNLQKLDAVLDILRDYGHQVEVRPLKGLDTKYYTPQSTFLFDTTMGNIANARKRGFVRINHVDNTNPYRNVIAQIAKEVRIPEIKNIASGRRSANMDGLKLQQLLVAAQDLQRYTLADLIIMAKYNGIDTDNMTHHDLAWLNALANF